MKKREDPMKGVDETLIGIGFRERQRWKKADPVLDEHSLRIFGQPVMEDWETPYMKALAEIATSNGGAVLEVGFGMGISARFIQEGEIKQHIIIEANQPIAARARQFADAALHPAFVLEGFWEDVTRFVPDDCLHGILFDTYPLSESELRNHFPFFPTAFKKLREGGVFTYFSDEEHMYQPEHLERLLDAGFRLSDIRGKLVHVETPSDCQYWKWKTILAPVITK